MAKNLNKQTKTSIDASFSNEKGNYRKLPSKFFYDKISLEKYKHSGKGHNLLIHAYYSNDSYLSEFTESTQSSTPDLLCKMLTLRGMLPVDIFEELRKILPKPHIDDEVIKPIINWCKKNGFPFKQIPKNNTKLKPLIKRDSAIYFGVWDFLKRLDEIYDAFLLYKIIIDQEDTNTKNRFKNKSKNECKKLFETMYPKIFFTNSISFEKEIHLNIKTDNLFDAAFYQLALMLTTKEEVGECPLCHIIFPKEHASQIYCKTLDLTPDGKYKYKNDGKIK